MALKLMPTTEDTTNANTLTATTPALAADKPAKAAQPGTKAKAGTTAAKPASKAPKAEKPLTKRAQVEADAAAGKLPTPPNCALESNKRHRPKLAALDAMIAAGDIAGLRAFEIKLVSSTPKALDRYRNLAIVALEARAAKKAA